VHGTLSERVDGDQSAVSNLPEIDEHVERTRQELYGARLVARREAIAGEWLRSGTRLVAPIHGCACGSLAHLPDRGCDFSGESSP
jgi:hypothetical protein